QSKLKIGAQKIQNKHRNIGLEYPKHNLKELIHKFDLEQHFEEELGYRSWNKVIAYVMWGNGDDIKGLLDPSLRETIAKKHMAKTGEDKGIKGGRISQTYWNIPIERKPGSKITDSEASYLLHNIGRNNKEISDYLNLFYDNNPRHDKSVGRALTNYRKEYNLPKYKKGINSTKIFSQITY
ncbi:hypothetical protein K9M18_04190, partial [Candidatus Woesearchaeota archaeon]|nr:hypothetical protein [Candidatus Woesearchaeota archaeon]